ncbi:MAG TPA: TonB-dependent receptor [Nitrospiraceae bacterium]|nr:TonB-dependent receptor [Nitrospiraceae bacterium]
MRQPHKFPSIGKAIAPNFRPVARMNRLIPSKRYVYGLVLLALIWTAPPSRAEDGLPPEMEIQREEEEVITASRRLEPISKAPANVYVITDDDIRQSGAPDLPTVLRRVPGLEVMQVTGAQFNVSARGDNQAVANKMLVLVDGRSIYVDISGEVFWKAIPVTLPEIKRIEVVKGPSSVLYGFNAFDGIINIITKSAKEINGTILQFGGGEYGTITSSAVHAGTADKFDYRLSVGHDQNNQWRDRNALAFRNNKFNVNMNYHLSGESRVFLEGGFNDVNRFDGNFTETVTPTQPFSDGYARAGYERGDFFVRAFFRRVSFEADVATNPVLAPFLRVTDVNGNQKQFTDTNTYDIEAQHTLHWGKLNSLSYGVNFRRNTLNSSWANAGHEDRFGLYLQDEFRPHETFTVVGGVRYDMNSLINPTVSPRLSLIYRPSPDHSFRATAAVAYRSPQLVTEQFRAQSTVTLPTIIPGFQFTSVNPLLGSQNLKPEQIISYDAGYQGWYLKHTLRIRADIFFNHISDLIGTSNADLSNRGGSADIYGGEAGFDFDLTKWLSIFGNFSYQEIGQTFGDDTRRGAPRFKINGGARADFENGLNGEVAIFHVGSATYPVNTTFSDFALGFPPFIPPVIAPSAVPVERVNHYNLLNIRVGYRFWKDKAEAAVSVFNALNDRHREHPLGDLIGSRVMGWLTLKL